MRIDDLGRGGIEQIAAHRGEQLGVPGLIPGIGRKVLPRRELGRIDEDAGHGPLGALAGAAHQRQVPLMQGAHGGDQGDPLALGAPAAHPRSELGHGADGGQVERGHENGI